MDIVSKFIPSMLVPGKVMEVTDSAIATELTPPDATLKPILFSVSIEYWVVVIFAIFTISTIIIRHLIHRVDRMAKRKRNPVTIAGIRQLWWELLRIILHQQRLANFDGDDIQNQLSTHNLDHSIIALFVILMAYGGLFYGSMIRTDRVAQLQTNITDTLEELLAKTNLVPSFDIMNNIFYKFQTAAPQNELYQRLVNQVGSNYKESVKPVGKIPSMLEGTRLGLRAMFVPSGIQQFTYDTFYCRDGHPGSLHYSRERFFPTQHVYVYSSGTSIELRERLDWL